MARRLRLLLASPAASGVAAPDLAAEFVDASPALTGGVAVRIGDAAPVSVRDLGDGRFSVATSGGSLELTAARVGDTVWVGCEGEALPFQIVEADHATGPSTHGRDALMPPMSATVVRIHVGPGDAVDAGDTLLVLEAMKMELPVRAPRSGRVRAVNCAEGQLVHPGTLLIELEE